MKEEIEVVTTDHKMISIGIFGGNCPGGGWLLRDWVCLHDVKVVAIFPMDTDERILKGITGEMCFTNPIYRRIPMVEHDVMLGMFRAARIIVTSFVVGALKQRLCSLAGRLFASMTTLKSASGAFSKADLKLVT